MKCINCGAEIKSDFNICPYCGKTVQMVPDYNIYDEDDINIILEGTKDIESKNNKAYIREQKEKEEIARKKAVEDAKLKKEKKKKMLIIGVCTAVVVLVITIIAGVVISNNSSYHYQMKKADSAMNKANYELAEKYYLKALNIEPEKIAVQLKLADLYIKQGNDEEALEYLNSIVDKGTASTDELERAYKMFYKIYSETKDVDAILELTENISDKKLLAIFEEYVVEPPTLSQLTGNYSSVVDLTIKAKKGLEIYYTADLSDPRENGILYIGPITFGGEGVHTVKVVTKNKDGFYSDVVSETYTISYIAPEDPVVNPDGGTFYSPTYVYITVPADCIAYYTWDRTDPTIYSNVYTSALLVPEGYNVLSIMIVDTTTGLQSAIYRGAFEYITD